MATTKLIKKLITSLLKKKKTKTRAQQIDEYTQKLKDLDKNKGKKVYDKPIGPRKKSKMAKSKMAKQVRWPKSKPRFRFLWFPVSPVS